MTDEKWKILAKQEMNILQILFFVNLIWEFFLTIVIDVSSRAHVLLDIGVYFAPYITGLWIVIIVGFIILLPFMIKYDFVKQPTVDFWAIIVKCASVLLFVTLVIISILNPFVPWPIVVSFGVDLAWSVILLYFSIAHKE